MLELIAHVENISNILLIFKVLIEFIRTSFTYNGICLSITQGIHYVFQDQNNPLKPTAENLV